MTMINKRIAILQPEVPHYRNEFFNCLKRELKSLDIYVYNSIDDSIKNGFKVDKSYVKYIPNFKFKGFLFYNPFSLLKREQDTLVLMLHFAHITTWLLLLTKFIHRKQIILWGQGISVKRYLKEEIKPDWKLKLQIALADGVWFYMEKEAKQWKQIFPKKKIVAINNTLTGVEEMVKYTPSLSIQELKNQYNIKEKIILIFCARFESNYRRTDLLIETIKRLNKEKYGFIIIGAGKNKPDFTPFTNVYDFGAIYDTNVKRELFSIADIYFQPGWVGLSIVEAMAYGKPVFTFVRSEETKQCVEYDYIKPSYNGIIFQDIDNCITTISNLSIDEIKQMGVNARETAMKLTPENMANKAISIL